MFAQLLKCCVHQMLADHSILGKNMKTDVRVLSSDLSNVLLHVAISCGGSWRFNSGCCGGNHNESAAELVQDSVPKPAQEIQHRVCGELPSGARQRQKPQHNFGSPTTAARQHNWEAADAHTQSSGAVPELDEHDESWLGDDVDDNDPKLALDLATQAFLDCLLDLADESKISAKDVCVLCWYASKSGMSDDVRRIGFRPDAPSGHYQRHLDSVLDFAERRSQFYKLQVVGTRKQDASRNTFDMFRDALLCAEGWDVRRWQTA